MLFVMIFFTVISLGVVVVLFGIAALLREVKEELCQKKVEA